MLSFFTPCCSFAWRWPFNRLRNEPNRFSCNHSWYDCLSRLSLSWPSRFTRSASLGDHTFFVSTSRYILRPKESWSARGFEPSTLGVAIFYADSLTTPLPFQHETKYLFSKFQLSKDCNLQKAKAFTICNSKLEQPNWLTNKFSDIFRILN